MSGGTRRLDQWLWFARFARTRSLAARLCTGVGVAGAGERGAKPGRALRVGDRLTVPQGRRLLSVEVLALGERRGPAAEARLLFREVAPPLPLAEDEAWEPLLGEEGEDET